MFFWTGLRLLGIPATFATRLFRLGYNVKPVGSAANGPVTVNDVLDSTYVPTEEEGAAMSIATLRTEV
jgi:hypothetical protein